MNSAKGIKLVEYLMDETAVKFFHLWGVWFETVAKNELS